MDIKSLFAVLFQAYEANPTTDKKASAEDLIRYTKPITQATAKAVAAGNSARQEDVIVVANMGRKAVFDLLGVCKVGLDNFTILKSVLLIHPFTTTGVTLRLLGKRPELRFLDKAERLCIRTLSND